MIDKFLEVGSSMDGITPLWAFVQDWLNRPAYHINMPYPQANSLAAIEKGLRSKGVRCWGGMIVGKTMLLTVRKPQAKYALYWLGRWGCL